MLCPKCGFDNPDAFAFCGRCGSATTLIVSRHEAEGRYSSRAERRQLTVMFCDLVGSTALSGQLDPEELNDLTREYQRVCAEVIERYEGRIAQFLGDGLLVYFGYPISHEDDAQRAVRAGLGIVGAISKVRERLAKPLHVRVGVHTGLVVVGQLGGISNPDPMAVAGETPNIAHRLQTIAEPGRVLVSSATYRLIEGFFVCRSLGTPTLRGVASPIEVYSVLEESGIQTRFEKAVAAGLTPFVSRENELGLLLKRWQLARQGHGQVAMLSGEAGIGKSRLVRVLQERTVGEAFWELGCRCSPYYQNSPLYPVIEFFQRILRFNRDDEAASKLAKLEEELQRFGFSLPEAVPLFAALLSLPNSERYPAPTTTPQRQKRKTLEAIVEWLLRAAEQGPTRLVFEDLHWADPSTLELIDLLIEPVRAAPLLLILAFRPEFVPPWPAHLHVTSVTLGRLARPDAELMVRSVADGEQLPTEVVNEIAAKTEGVPLFVEELTRMLLESELLRQQNGHYVLTRPLPELAIPSTLYDSLMARLDRLGTAKEVAQIAAIIGRQFSYELLRAISPLEETNLTGALNRLVDAELLEQYLSQPRLSYRFKHALIRDAAYESLLKSQRRHYHRKLAEALQERFAETVEARPELLANHFAEAGLIELAIPYWQRAGQRALERSANQEAIRHLTRGLELLDTVAETRDRLRQELGLQTTLGTALIATKGFSTRDVVEVYTRARELSQRVGEVTEFFRVLWGQWLNCSSRAEYGAALELGLECLRVAHDAGDPVLLVEAHHALGVGYGTTGEFDKALDHLEQAVALYDPKRHSLHAHTYGQDPAVLCLIHSGWNLWFLGYPDRALKRNDEGLALAQEFTHRATLATAAAFGAWLQQFCRNPQGVEELARIAVDLSTQHDFAFIKAIGMILEGWALTQSGQKETGIERMRSGLEVLRATDAVTMVGYFSGLLAEAYGEAGLAEEGLSILSGVVGTRERYWEAELHRLKGELMLTGAGARTRPLSSESEAETCFRQALAVARAQNAKSLELRAAMSLCRLYLRQGKRSDAGLGETFAWFTEGLKTPDLRDAKMLLDKWKMRVRT
jgi:class 3 adenylate cyclase/predicted ATPase